MYQSTASDRHLELEVWQRLRETLPAQVPRLHVVVMRRICYVRGTVESYEEKRRLDGALSRVDGIIRLVNYVRIAPASFGRTPSRPRYAERVSRRAL